MTTAVQSTNFTAPTGEQPISEICLAQYVTKKFQQSDKQDSGQLLLAHTLQTLYEVVQSFIRRPDTSMMVVKMEM
jgi:hypothetical protein